VALSELGDRDYLRPEARGALNAEFVEHMRTGSRPEIRRCLNRHPPRCCLPSSTFAWSSTRTSSVGGLVVCILGWALSLGIPILDVRTLPALPSRPILLETSTHSATSAVEDAL
jgi:hypothetical protein